MLVNTWPKLSETFILNEVIGLERMGMDLRLFALQHPTDTIFHAATKAVRAPVGYVPVARGVKLAALALSPLRHAILHPRRTLAAWRAAAGPGRLRFLLRGAALADAVRREGIDHLHAHFASAPASLARVAAAFAGVRYSISAHAKDIYLGDPLALADRVRAAAFTVTCTEYNRQHLARLAGPGGRVVRMYHGIDLAKFQRSRAPAAPTSDLPLVLSVGRLREKKGFATLIRACAELRATGCPVRCEIVGYGPERERLAALIAELDLSEVVQLVDKMTHEALRDRYAAATAFALPCQVGADGDRDGIPNVLLEAMAMELPVVTTDVSGIPEVVQDRVNGRVVRPEDPAALAAAIRSVVRDDTAARLLARNARATVERHFANERNLATVRDLLVAAASRTPAALPARSAEPASHAQ